MAVRDHAVSVAELLDSGRLTVYQRWRVALVALTIVFDGIDNQLLGIVIPTLMAEWHLPRRAFAPVVSLGYLGMMAGGLVAGLVGDRIGRRTALLGSMILFGVLTIAGAFVHSPEMMAALRFLAGIGLGGAMPNAATLAAEYVPARLRPVAVTITIVCVPLGATLAGVLGIQVLPLIGWRNLFIAGGLVPDCGRHRPPLHPAGVAALSRPARAPLARTHRRPGKDGTRSDARRRLHRAIRSRDGAEGVDRVAVQSRIPPRHARALGRLLLVHACRLPVFQLADDAVDRGRLQSRDRQHRHHAVQPWRGRWRARRRRGDRALRLETGHARNGRGRDRGCRWTGLSCRSRRPHRSSPSWPC